MLQFIMCDVCSKKGNILFLILIAVALFATLSYVITQGNRSNGAKVTVDKAKTVASEIISYSNLIRNTVEKLRLINGCKLSEISFYSDKTNMGSAIESYYINPNSPVDKSCHIFDPNGGGISYRKEMPNPKLWSLDPANSLNTSYYFVKRGQVVGIGLRNNTDLIMALSNIKEELCVAINLIALKNDLIEEYRVITNHNLAYNGTFIGDGNNDSYAKISGIYDSQPTGCVKNPSSGTYDYYFVLVER